jgi:hypothetical protein
VFPPAIYTVSTTLVSLGPLWGAGEAARGKGPAAAGFAAGELAGFPAEASSRAETWTLDAATITASHKYKSHPAGRHA